MGKKYIIEIPDDKIGDFIGSTHFLMPYMMAGHIGHHDTGLPIAPYTELDMEKVRKEAYEAGAKSSAVVIADDKAHEAYKLGYENGINDAWEAARTLWNTPNRKEIFGHTTFNTVLTTLTAQEAIEKIRQYEQEKKDIRVGDEVVVNGLRGVVMKLDEKGNVDRYFISDGKTFGNITGFQNNEVTKTGRHFPEIAEVLQKMKENSDG